MVTVCVRDDKFGLWGKEKDPYAVHKVVRASGVAETRKQEHEAQYAMGPGRN